MGKVIFVILFSLIYSLCAAQEKDSTYFEEVFTIVEKMPVFGDCNKMIDENPYKGYYRSDKEQDCSVKNIMNHIEDEVEKSTINVTEKKTVYVRYIIDTLGQAINHTIVNDSSENELNAEAIRIIKTMQNWTPGAQRGKKVPVQYVTPVVFK